jgi:DNA-binding transcriptional regulator YiaG
MREKEQAQRFKQAQKRMGLNNAQMAATCIVSVRTVERWRAGHCSVPGSVMALLECLKHRKEGENEK